jgi:hypothetical protein
VRRQGQTSLSSDALSGTAGSISTRARALKRRVGANGGKRNLHCRWGRCDRPGLSHVQHLRVVMRWNSDGCDDQLGKLIGDILTGQVGRKIRS